VFFCVVNVVFCGKLVSCHFNKGLKDEFDSGEVRWKVKEGAGGGIGT